jgi:peptidoglycan/xylan/chitin deacetylase (PgdA/CDA1 family)
MRNIRDLKKLVSPLPQLAARCYSASVDLMHDLSLTTAIDHIEGPRGCLFTFHRVAKSSEWINLPNRDFYIDLDFLDQLMSHFRRRGWRVVTMNEAVRAVNDRKFTQRFVSFSIDDAYRDTYEMIVPLFRKHDIPVTIYVTTGIPDQSCLLWTTGLETILRQQDLVLVPDGDGARRLDVATVEAKRLAYRDLSRQWELTEPISLYRKFCELNGYDAMQLHKQDAIDWDMLAELRSDPLVEIGAHTVSHARISALTEGEALTEMAGSRARLQDHLGIDVNHFAFPYGRSGDCGPRDFALASRAGFASAATTRKGLLSRSMKADSHSLPRITINGNDRSMARMEAHLIGLSSLASAVARVS